MPDIVNEALLEMHYHPAIRDCFEAVFGAKVLRILKPSTQHEAWLGFDQAWVRTRYHTSEILADLRSTLQGAPLAQRFYLGFFLQFKLLQRRTRRSKNTPPKYGTPYYQAKLSLTPNASTNLSQHETLCRLAKLANTSVNYVCAMIDSADEIYDTPDLNKLICVDVSNAPGGWLPTEDHFIVLQQLGAHPDWCSEPVPVRSITLEDWILSRSRRDQMSGAEAASLISAVLEVLDAELPALRSDVANEDDLLVHRFPESFVLYEFQE